MSLILDALNRAERERNSKNVVPDITTVHAQPDYSLQKKPVPMLLWIILLFVLMIIIMAAGVFWWSGPAQKVSAPASVPIAAQSPVIHTSVVASPITSAAAGSATPVQKVEPVTKIAQATSSVAMNNNADVENLYNTDNKAKAAPSGDAIVNELYAAEDVAPASESIVNPFATTETVVDTAEEEAPQKQHTFDSTTDVKDFNELPWSQKQLIPTISYSRHDYLPNNVSIVVINGETRGIGNLISGHFILEEILVDGVVLRYQDKVFKMRALSGWVNM